ncbi:hypothetical protein EDD68_12416 [Melghiribacillus thermohalophilus]|uniref:Uncharacterized protein n=1 Tax=Melghiribacillus thermohalophilus TaxID=1324956 RepID=A0A4R3MW06_9BACI|nr:hypothetical protein [Melghiribacillus thermohalophilus]TCT18064.1 hypothetical protein EDD68_12416 [Melghiribacillus thermohalophilus]
MNGTDLMFLYELLIENGNLGSYGITADHLQFLIGLAGMAILYYLLQPLMSLLIRLKWARALTYFSISFILLFFLTWFELYQGITDQGKMEFSDLASSSFSIVFFGIILLVSHLASELKRYVKRRYRKSAVR